MKKIITYMTCLFLGVILYFLCFNYNTLNYPNEFYNVYLDGSYLGTIESKDDLTNYIDAKAEHLINVENVTKKYCEDDKTLHAMIKIY